MPICILLNGLISFVLGMAVLLAALRVLGHRLALPGQLVILAAVLSGVSLGNALWWKSPALQVQGVVPWMALLLYWSGLVYFYSIHFETITRDGGPAFILFRFIDASPSGSRTKEEILDYFSHQAVLSGRIEALVTGGWLRRMPSGSYLVTWRGRFILFVLDGWLRLLGYPWGG